MKIKLLLLSCIMLELAYGQQENDAFYLFNKDWKPVEMKKAAYFLRVRHVSDSNWEWTFYVMYGPRIKSASYKDEKATIKNGKFVYYLDKGSIDSMGNYKDGEFDGEWYFKNEAGQITRKKTYNNGALLTDSVYEVSNKREKTKNNKLDSGDIESEFPGGLHAWANYLNHNMKYPDRALNKEVQGEVRIQFIVDKDGSVYNLEVNKSVEYSLDEEAMRIIKESPKWIPATQKGRIVKSYKIQPIDFRLQAN